MIKQQFDQCNTVEQVKTLFKTLARKYHPDLGGDTALMQEVNNCYHQALQRVQYNNVGDNNHYRYDDVTEHNVADKLYDILSVVTEEVIVELVGNWIWISGDTKPIKDNLKEVGCRWSNKRKMWYWTATAGKGRWASKLSYGEIKQKYGSEIARKYRVIG